MTTETSFPTHAVLGRFDLTGPAPRRSPEALAAQWRGAVASRFPGETAFHGHEGERTVRRYPEVHYRWIEGTPHVFAFGPAAERVMTHAWPGERMRLADDERAVAQVEWRPITLARSFSRRLVRYAFGAPWLALNQGNHARFGRLSAAERRAELDRILVANLLAMSKGLGWIYAPDETVYAAFELQRERACVLKSVSLVGFEGTFVTNLELPDHLALGKSVSHGYGWFARA